jgi:hypothetical protein
VDQTANPVSLTSRWLPQLDLVPFRIDHPAKLTELRVINFFPEGVCTKLARQARFLP